MLHVKDEQEERMEQQSVEVWKNTALGYRHFFFYDRLGHEASQMVRGEATFTITTFARQMNQQRAATPELDAFRNGTFVLIKAGDATDKSEIESPESYTDHELMALAHEVMAKNKTVEMAILNMSNSVTLERFRERLALEEAPMEIIEVVKAKSAEMDGGPPVRRGQVVSQTPSQRMPKIENNDPEGEDTASPGRELVPERVK